MSVIAAICTWIVEHTTAVVAAVVDRWRQVRSARARRDQELMDWPAILRAAMSDRGACRVCGEDHALRHLDGRVRKHGDCPGGDELPAPLLIGGAA